MRDVRVQVSTLVLNENGNEMEKAGVGGRAVDVNCDAWLRYRAPQAV